MNWKKFELKYDKRETWAFEQMAYLLFCSEFNNRIGIFRYKNQAGIETNPIEHDGKLIGFQAKYYPNGWRFFLQTRKARPCFCVKNTEIPLLLKWDKKAYGSLDKMNVEAKKMALRNGLQ